MDRMPEQATSKFAKLFENQDFYRVYLGTGMWPFLTVSHSDCLRLKLRISENRNEDRKCDAHERGQKDNRGIRGSTLRGSLADSHSLFLVHDGSLKALEIGGIEVPEALEKHRDVQMNSALDELKKPIEEWARALVDGKPMENLLILYKLLYALGCRIDGIDFEIDRLCVAVIKKAKTLS